MTNIIYEKTQKMTVFFLNTVIFLKVFTKIIAVLFTAVSSQNNITAFFRFDCG